MKTATGQDWLLQATQKLNALRRLPANWDSHDGLPLQPGIFDAALEGLRWIGEQELPVPAVVLGSAGTVQFEWQCDGRELQVEIAAPDAIGWLKIAADGSMQEGRDEPSSPDQLRRLTQWLVHG